MLTTNEAFLAVQDTVTKFGPSIPWAYFGAALGAGVAAIGAGLGIGRIGS